MFIVFKKNIRVFLKTYVFYTFYEIRRKIDVYRLEAINVSSELTRSSSLNIEGWNKTQPLRQKTVVSTAEGWNKIQPLRLNQYFTTQATKKGR